MDDGGRRPPQTDLGIAPLARGQERPGPQLIIAVLIHGRWRTDVPPDGIPNGRRGEA